MQTPTVTVAIVSYGRRDIVLDTIDEVLAQPTLPAHIIVVDQDTPCDNSDAMSRCATAGTECRYVFSNYRSTPCARNYAVSLCDTDVILFIDDDVEVKTDIVAAHAAVHHAQPDVEAAGGHLTCYPRSAAHIRKNTFQPEGRYLNSAKGGNMSFKVAAVRRAGGFNNFIFTQNEETDFLARLLRHHGGRIANCPEALVLHLACSSGGTRTDTAWEFTWYRNFLRDHVVSITTNRGIFFCIVWLLKNLRLSIALLKCAPGFFSGLRALAAETLAGWKLGLTARRMKDHVSFSCVLAENDIGVTCPMSFLEHRDLLTAENSVSENAVYLSGAA